MSEQAYIQTLATSLARALLVGKKRGAANSDLQHRIAERAHELLTQDAIISTLRSDIAALRAELDAANEENDKHRFDSILQLFGDDGDGGMEHTT